jgi:hypothetical protein
MNTARQPVLVFRGGCAKCRVLSRLAVLLSIGLLRRVAHDSPEGQALQHALGLTRVKLTLVTHEKVVRGWRVLACLPLVVGGRLLSQRAR